MGFLCAQAILWHLERRYAFQPVRAPVHTALWRRSRFNGREHGSLGLGAGEQHRHGLDRP